MAHYIDKSALVAEIKKRRSKNARNKLNLAAAFEDDYLLSFIDALEVKEIGISISNIDNLFEENSIDPNSKVAKNFKESYYMALENFKAQKG